jgi:hydrogenase maturation protein HypF
MTWTISIKGQVQGVGFRPFVWRAALDHQLTGWVMNGLEGVLITFNATEAQALYFHDYVLQNAPPTAHITAAVLTPLEASTFFDNFSIRESRLEGQPVLHLTSDIALCAACRQDMSDPANRRYRYPFTTCTVCGPRFSILTGLPYDRPLTTMKMFTMCDKCQSEYDDPANRRYFAQTNSCPDCGIQLRLVENNIDPTADTGEKQLDNQQIIQKVIGAWQKGAIVAVKGVGGFLLTCDATNPTAVATLRTRKNRPAKPLAMMYPDLDILLGDAKVNEAALLQLQNPAAPIVLVDVLSKAHSGFDHAGIAPGLHQIGVMLPNAPLFEVLLRDFGKPIVATSGNISHSPLVYEDYSATLNLPGIADVILLHNRAVVMPQDDSVVAVQSSGPPVIIRRARGFAPAFIQPGLSVPNATMLALGAEMKSTFTLAHLGNIHISPYLGDLSDYEVQERFQLVLEHLTGLFIAQPVVVISDLHPGYYTTQLGQILARQWQATWIQVQHHQAHFAAVLAENNLWDTDELILGVIWDGTGLGTDSEIWGGEFFEYKGAGEAADPFCRCAHFDYFPVILGDKMPREPRLSALLACWELEEAQPWLQPLFSATEWDLYPKLAAGSSLQTSSVGRIFDAVAALLGLAAKISYEGEAALLLEDMARQYCNHCGIVFSTNYLPGVVTTGSTTIHTTNFFRHIIRDLKEGKDKAYIAAQFHWSLVHIIGHIALVRGHSKIAFSGGVFQNTLLLDMIDAHLSPDYQLYTHRQLSPNDENISFGQWAYYSNQSKYVFSNSR